MKTLLALSAVLFLSVGVAQAESKPVTLTPTALYDLIEKEQEKNSKQTQVLLGLNKKLVDTRSSLVELERKVAGMQKQITVLHAKKVDK